MLLQHVVRRGVCVLGEPGPSDVSAKKHGHSQTRRSKEEQKQHRRDYGFDYLARERALLEEAQLRTKSYVLVISRRIEGVGEFGQFTIAQAVTIEFAVDLSLHLPHETMQKSHKGINSAAAQKLSALLKVGKAFSGGIADLRAPGEPAVTDYVAIHKRALLPGAQEPITRLLSYLTQQERLRHPHALLVKELPADASLIEVVCAGALASKPRMGRDRACII